MQFARSHINKAKMILPNGSIAQEAVNEVQRKIYEHEFRWLHYTDGESRRSLRVETGLIAKSHDIKQQ